MARIKDREKALALRKQEKSYSQIKNILGVSKGTLSYWLRDYPLSKKRVEELQKKGWKKSEASREKFRITMRKKRKERLERTYNNQEKIILPLSNRDLFIAGLFLYWGEGSKSQKGRLSISNSDPSVIKFFIAWLNKSLLVPERKMKVHLHLYKDMEIEKEINFWSKKIKLPKNQFYKPYIKKSSSKRINHKGGFGHGTCNVTATNVILAEKVFMGLKVLKNNID